MPSATPPILFLDISRLVRRHVYYGGPTGIDRIEIAYARRRWADDGFDLRFVAGRGAALRLLSSRAVAAVIGSVERRWASAAPPGLRTQAGRVADLAAGAAAELRRAAVFRDSRPLGAERPSVVLNVSHDGLEVEARWRTAPGAKVALIHDVIPLTHPEYDTPRLTALHAERIRVVAALATHVLTNSEATRQALLAAAPGARFTSSVAHFGPALVAPAAPAVYDRPTFVHVSTINRRKNLALLLHLWRDLAAEPDAPRLVAIGRRGNDGTALELLDRCAALRPLVDAPGALPDEEVARRVAGARALLSPSFAEGFGLPIIEAHALGVPVIASDLPAHREIGGAATFLSPLDGPGWRAAILRLARDDAAHRDAVAAITPPPSWDDHFGTVGETLHRLAR
jgi:glycosyltransferase involved in cell wall biosynthesis